MAKEIKLVPRYRVLDNDVNTIADLLSLMEDSQGLRSLKTKSGIRPAGKKGLKVTYQFKIKLRGTIKPPVWRRVLVPAHFTFSGLHAVIQESFGWWNEHLYCFGDTPYSRSLSIAEPREDDWSLPDYNARTFTLGEFFGEGNGAQKLCYVYDFGDDWTHDIALEKVIAEPSSHATCVTGKGACPEEDSGGIWDYEEMKQSGEIDAYDFDVEEVREGVEDLPPTGYEAW